ncbi:MAG: DmsC/YnfH family molybdoenzyme membrane anchor subunit [Terriglobales bacterium]
MYLPIGPEPKAAVDWNRGAYLHLPLIERARDDGTIFVLTPGKQGSGMGPAMREDRLYDIQPFPSVRRIPQRQLEPGEQYRFHFDMTKCIGCKCCIVACNEQNGNPAEINWRRVGEIEGGWYPHTQRFYLSMGCNHCLEPSCMIGCPVEAYKKDAVTGIVQHSPETCIGCQYCTWNCSYGVPQYNPERGVVGKCDMCYGRLAEGREPACVNACPETAIQIEIVNVLQWKKEYARSANAPGLPSADDSISTTRITLPDNMPPDIKKADSWRVRPEHPHWPLVFMLVLTQLSVGALAVIWLVQLLGKSSGLGVAALGALAVAGLALNAATLHLGRPIHAYRAIKMWKRSWLSREILMFACFSGTGAAYAGSLWFHLRISPVLGLSTALLGTAGIAASAFIYLVKARPAWNSKHTVADFFLTGALLGSLFAASIGVTAGRWLVAASVVAAAAQMLNQAVKFLRLTASENFEMQASAKLLSTTLKTKFLLRFALLIGGGIVLPLFTSGRGGMVVALVAALSGEILGRYLFFVSVVPKNMAAPYVAARSMVA